MTYIANRRFGAIRHILILPTLAILLLSSGFAFGKDDNKTGYEKDDVFYDNRYGYSFELPEDWKVGKTYDEKDGRSIDRVIVFRKKFRIPVKLQEYRELVQRPTALILIDSTEMTPAQLFQRITGSHELDKFGEAIISRSILLQRGVQTPAQVTESVPVTIAGREGVRWQVRLEYAHQLQTQFGPQLVRDWWVGNVYILQLDGKLMYLEQVCENQSFDSLMEEFGVITSTLKFASDSSADSTKAGAEEKSE